MGEALAENGRKDLKTACTDNSLRCFALAALLKRILYYQTFRAVERMAIGTVLIGILGSNKGRMDAKDFT